MAVSKFTLLWQAVILILLSYSYESKKNKAKHDRTTWLTDSAKHIILNTGAKMPLVGYGTWQAQDKLLEVALEKALKAGYRHIDTAHFYKNEQVIGNVLHKWITSGNITREELFITTKLPHYGTQPQLVTKYFEESLKNLQLDYIDLYLMHAPYYVPETDAYDQQGKLKIINNDFVGVWKEMETLSDRRKARAIGISNFNETQVKTLLNHSRITAAINQIELSVFLQQKSLVEYCKKHKIALTAYSTLGSRGTYETVLKDEQAIPNMLENEVVVKIAEKHGKTPAQILLRFMIQQDITVIPKAVTEQHIKENIDLFSFRLRRREMRSLEQLEQGEKYRVLKIHHIIKGLENHPNYPFPHY